MVYRVLPDVRLDWPDVWVEAVTTSLLFGIGKFLIGLYLGHASIGSSYGAAGSLVVFLVWVYYSSLIMFFGAELPSSTLSIDGEGFVPPNMRSWPIGEH